jgi:hypothetical protein
MEWKRSDCDRGQRGHWIRQGEAVRRPESIYSSLPATQCSLWSTPFLHHGEYGVERGTGSFIDP